MPMRYLPAIIAAFAAAVVAFPAGAQRMAGFSDVAVNGKVLELRVPL